uniref:Uncharacterized protein n=1 Tax=Candidatus Kentrum sp. UNK TaxID=2126344 RepID=A0A451ASH0_9GAMM|nr:MAG: hypothetical protein BECKUNK1418G_GA0071005_12981 [Candidatus Kentron sp. UNK]VFK73768.1 MAG: hypothetical protein BECKUNK1418H_GA0071006_12841 [Candidatus Kentron sp. UNK]
MILKFIFHRQSRRKLFFQIYTILYRKSRDVLPERCPKFTKRNKKPR